MLAAMRHATRVRLCLAAALCASVSTAARAARAQDLPRVSVSRALVVEGVVADPTVSDLLGLSRVRFQGLIATELSAVGYRVEGAGADTLQGLPPLVLAGVVKEEICDDIAPSQCRVAIQWELQERNGSVVYRTVTRAVDQQPTLDRLRRVLIQGALRSLMGRRRFASRLGSGEPAPSGATLGFKQCRRETLGLPAASRAALAALVLVESGSSLSVGAVLSTDGLILAATRAMESDAPLRVRFSAQQVVPARVVASAPEAGVALLRADARTSLCLPVRDSPLSRGATAFVVGSDLHEERALSLVGAVMSSERGPDGSVALRVDGHGASAPGTPLLDESARLAAVVVDAAHSPEAVEVQSALTALRVKPAAITDPRLLSAPAETIPAIGFVRDPDDPPYALARSYTYGTSGTAGQVRRAAAITAGVGALGVAATWLQFHGKSDISTSEHTRLVVYNDVSWAVLALGAVGFGISYALPESHDVVAGHGTARRHLMLSVAASGLGANGEF